MKKINPQEVPLKHRHVLAISPGLLFADDYEMKWPKENWEDIDSLAKALHKKDTGYVGFRRFIYDPEEGQVFLDKGWVYFNGTVYKGKDIVSGKVSISGGEIACANIVNNDIDEVVWFPKSQKMYPLNKNDKFVKV